jgi:phosphoglucosamine mutase
VEAVAAMEASLNGSGRLLIRESGTEPLVRVMAEAEDDETVGRIVDDLCAVIADVARAREDAD